VLIRARGDYLDRRSRDHIISECNYEDSGYSCEDILFECDHRQVLYQLITLEGYSPLEPPTAFWVVYPNR
jgi:hypothetical protein